MRGVGRTLRSVEGLLEVHDPLGPGHPLGRGEDLSGVAVVQPQDARTTVDLEAGLTEGESAGVDPLGAVTDDEQPVAPISPTDEGGHQLESDEGEVLRLVDDRRPIAAAPASLGRCLLLGG